jgi:8-oxo-dGTP pyrophosphatase MutT (NUDIX family)
MTRSRANQPINDCEIKWKGDYVDLVIPDASYYEMLHEKDFVAILPFIKNDSNSIFILREEYCPAYNLKSFDEFFNTVVTGKIDSNDTYPEDAMIRELREEAGIEEMSYEIIEKVDNAPIHKTTDARCTFFLVEINDYTQIEVEGDGSRAEEISECFPTKEPSKYLNEKNDMLLHFGLLLANKHNLINLE